MSDSDAINEPGPAPDQPPQQYLPPAPQGNPYERRPAEPYAPIGQEQGTPPAPPVPPAADQPTQAYGQYAPPPTSGSPEQPAGYGAYAPTGYLPPVPPPPTEVGGGSGGGFGGFGARALRRPEARLGTAFAGGGVALAVLGALIWSVGYIVEGVTNAFDGDGTPDLSSRRILGIVLGIVLALGGYAVALLAKRGPLVTLGVAASAIGVPVFLLFVSMDLDFGSFGSNPLEKFVNLDVIAPVSIVIWLVSYFLIPVVRGHNFYLALAATALFSYVSYKVVVDDLVKLISGAVGGALTGGGGLGTLQSLPNPDDVLNKLIAVGFIFGIAYYAIAFLLDAKGKHAVAVPFLYAAPGALSVGVIAAARDLKEVGTGIVLIVFGAAIAALGARAGRRFTTWAGTAAAAFGVLVIVFKIFSAGDVGAPAGGAIIAAVGIVFALAGWVFSVALKEKDEFEPTGGTQLPLH